MANVDQHFTSYVSARREALARSTPGRARAPATGPELASTQAALARLSELNREHARMLEEEAARRDRFANALGAVAIATTVVLIGVTIPVARSWLLAPIEGLHASMLEFRGGSRDARAPEGGIAELDGIAQQWNDVVSSLAEHDRDRRALIGGIVHDLRQPVTTLRLAFARLEQAHPPEGDARRETFVRAHRQLARLARMLDDFLESATAESRSLDLRPSLTDLPTLVRTIADEFREFAPDREVRVFLPEKAVSCVCDVDRIRRALSNLVANAIKYSPKGSQIEISLSVSTAGDEAEIAVADEGVGISPEDMAHIFEPFHRTRASRATTSGIGLGLSVARRLIEAHGGRLLVESQLGTGSTFRFSLPVIPSSTAEARWGRTAA